ncbi:GlcNAc-PI de-N-acetylase [Seinonella peptonophila]|uniref:GlcNAc-PI de-N-acetylase n=1 Tax=Seinonella peptonophila TaxID=112248 RepID=A0A1M4VC62_9BACL|nr:PIG-L family deacetylase [Seinonella peptonophila]SHE66526.1 GlcNAc-PI de-N-acetylase [Seinonella peptonophila]
MPLPAVFFSPHQDDETLSMSVDILRHIAAGRDTHVVLLTDGGNTSARWAINGYNSDTNTPVTSGYWGSRHDPAVEGYSPLTWNDIYDARDKEFRSALGQLGVPPSNIHLMRTTNRTVAGFKTAMQSIISQFPANTSYKTMSPIDTHDEHRVVAQALWELWNSGVVSDVRFWLSRLDVQNGVTGGSYQTAATTSAELAKIEKATRAYKAWNPAAGSFAVGYHSVPTQFEALLADPKFRYFLPTQFTTADLPF